MKGGRRPQPTTLKIVRGNPSGRPLNENEPDPGGPLGDAPDDWTDAAREIWAEVADLAPAGVLQRSDRILVELTVRNLAQLRSEAKVLQSASAELRHCLSECGMTPSERSRLMATKGRASNPFADL